MTFNSHCPLEAFYWGFQLLKENQLASNRRAEVKYKAINNNIYIYLKKRKLGLTNLAHG